MLYSSKKTECISIIVILVWEQPSVQLFQISKFPNTAIAVLASPSPVIRRIERRANRDEFNQPYEQSVEPHS
jgi:hypothetical protein